MKMENQITYIIGAIKYWLQYHLRAYILRTLEATDKDYKLIRKMPIAEESEQNLLGKEFIAKCNCHFIMI
jgi:hypothetical protein